MLFSKSSTLTSNGVIFWPAIHSMTSLIRSCIVTSDCFCFDDIFINNQLIIRFKDVPILYFSDKLFSPKYVHV